MVKVLSIQIEVGRKEEGPWEKKARCILMGDSLDTKIGEFLGGEYRRRKPHGRRGNIVGDLIVKETSVKKLHLMRQGEWVWIRLLKGKHPVERMSCGDHFFAEELLFYYHTPSAMPVFLLFKRPPYP